MDYRVEQDKSIKPLSPEELAEARKRAGELLGLRPSTLTPEQRLELAEQSKVSTEAFREDTYRRHGVSIPFPLDDIYYSIDDVEPADGVYDHDDPEYLKRRANDSYGAINDYLMFFYKPGLCLNKKQFDLAIGYAREIRGVYCDLDKIPFAEKPDNPTDNDFFRLGQWFLDAHTAITNDIATYNAARKQPNNSDDVGENPVSCIDVGNIVHTRPDSIARTLRAAEYPVVKKAKKNYCNPEHAAIIFPKWKKHWNEKKRNE